MRSRSSCAVFALAAMSLPGTTLLTQSAFAVNLRGVTQSKIEASLVDTTQSKKVERSYGQVAVYPSDWRPYGLGDWVRVNDKVPEPEHLKGKLNGQYFRVVDVADDALTVQFDHFVKSADGQVYENRPRVRLGFDQVRPTTDKTEGEINLDFKLGEPMSIPDRGDPSCKFAKFFGKTATFVDWNGNQRSWILEVSEPPEGEPLQIAMYERREDATHHSGYLLDMIENISDHEHNRVNEFVEDMQREGLMQEASILLLSGITIPPVLTDSFTRDEINLREAAMRRDALLADASDSVAVQDIIMKLSDADVFTVRSTGVSPLSNANELLIKNMKYIANVYFALRELDAMETPDEVGAALSRVQFNFQHGYAKYNLQPSSVSSKYFTNEELQRSKSKSLIRRRDVGEGQQVVERCEEVGLDEVKEQLNEIAAYSSNDAFVEGSATCLIDAERSLLYEMYEDVEQLMAMRDRIEREHAKLRGQYCLMHRIRDIRPREQAKFLDSSDSD